MQMWPLPMATREPTIAEQACCAAPGIMLPVGVWEGVTEGVMSTVELAVREDVPEPAMVGVGVRKLVKENEGVAVEAAVPVTVRVAEAVPWAVPVRLTEVEGAGCVRS